MNTQQTTDTTPLPQREGQGGRSSVTILGIESSCDDTSAAVIRDGVLLSNVTASQAVHEAYGGVVPELASRAHQQNIVPVVDQALKRAGVSKEELSAIAFTRGPGLMGSLLVGVSFAKGLAASLGIPMIDVNHLQGHVLAHFIKEKPLSNSPRGGEDLKSSGKQTPPSIQGGDGDGSVPPFPFLCLLVSGGNSQIVLVRAYNDMEIIGQTIDDAAGEAVDKCSKVMGLGYPGGPIIDRLARQGNPDAFQFAKPAIPGYNYSFSGLKTSFLYNLRDWLQEDPDFIEHHKEDLAASLEKTIVDILMNKLRRAAKDLKIKHVAVAGGVSANTGLREAFREHARRYGWTIYIPKFSYTTDNAAMIAITGYFKYLDKEFCPMDAPAYSRVEI
jgi:N6-L-threonylcarbamoyladenine synthase